jgi:hypothetical protein
MGFTNPGTFGQVTSLRFLNLSHNKITDLEQQSFGYLLNMEALDISHNPRSNISQGLLPVGGQLQYLNLQGLAPSFAPQYQAIDPAVSACSLTKPPTLLLDNSSICTTTELQGMDGSACYRVRCQTAIDPILFRCDNQPGSNYTVDDRNICDGVQDCPSGWDERNCSYSMELGALESASCASLYGCFSPSATLSIHNGACAILQHSSASIGTSCVLQYEYYSFVLAHNSTSLTYASTLQFSPSDIYMWLSVGADMTLNFSLYLSLSEITNVGVIDAYCVFPYTLSIFAPTTTTPSTTTVVVAATKRSSSSSTAVIGAVVGGCFGGLALLALLLFVWRKKGHEMKVAERVGVGFLTPDACIFQVGLGWGLLSLAR